MNLTPVSDLPIGARIGPERAMLDSQLASVLQLVLNAAQALCDGDASRVQDVCEDLTHMATNLQPAWGELVLRDGGTKIDLEQERQRLLLPLLEARALYLAALRRWRRSLCLRRSLLEMQSESPAYGADELSRWC